MEIVRAPDDDLNERNRSPTTLSLELSLASKFRLGMFMGDAYWASSR